VDASSTPGRRPRVAVVGSGVSGLTAAYVLQRDADVTLFEADDRLGGHAHTHDQVDAAGRDLAVDTGFIVHNERTYPELLRLFAELGVETQPTEMSMSVRCGGCGLEYAGSKGLPGLFPTRRNAVDARYLLLLAQVVRFHRRARAALAAPVGADGGESMTAFLERGRFGAYFVSHFVTPLISAVWSCAPERAGEYPARYLFQFLANHGMLSVRGAPPWRTVVGGSRAYVTKAAAGLSSVRLGTPVSSLARTADGVEIRSGDGAPERFDAAVVATHPDQALALLDRPTPDEARVLGAMAYSTNPTVLHSDPAVLPRAARARASWNYYLPDCGASAASVNVTYDMNRLQRLPEDTRYLVTLNDEGTVAPESVIERMTYHHPVYTPASVGAQAELPRLNVDRLAFAGAYHGWGFHEDGCRSGVAAAGSLGVTW
jgi:predicted NAD/FAD-binding protein